MANPTDTKPTDLDRIALDLFRGRSQHGLPAGMGKVVAIGCYRDAKAFLEAATEINAGKIDPEADDKNPLDIAFAPNLPKTHPCNVMSRQHGSMKRVQEIFQTVNALPADAKDCEELGYKHQEVRQVRDLFPGLLKKAVEVGALN